MEKNDRAAMFAAAHEEQHRTQKLRNLLLGRTDRPAALNPPAAIESAAALALSGTSCVIDGSVVQRAESRLADAIAAHDEVVVVTIGPDREADLADLFVKARENGHLAHRPNVRAVTIVTDFETCPASVLARLDSQEIPYIGILNGSRILVSPI
jgi:hypothetical protein